jgi:putative phosphoesterase
MKINFRFFDLNLDGLRVGVFHGDDDDLNKVLIESQLFDLLCFGHTHIPKIETVGKTQVINPGTLIGYKQETGNEPVTIALYNTQTKTGEIVDLKID